MTLQILLPRIILKKEKQKHLNHLLLNFLGIPKIYEDKKEKHLSDLPEKSDECVKSIYSNLENSNSSSNSTYSESSTSSDYSYIRKIFSWRSEVSSSNFLETTTDTFYTNITSNSVDSIDSEFNVSKKS